MARKGVPNQLNRRGEPLHLYMQRSINVGMAAKVINETLDGSVEHRPARLATAIEVYRKTVPNYQALAIEIEHKINNNILDLQAQALEAGLDPSILLPVEKKASPEKVSSTPPTPESADAD